MTEMITNDDEMFVNQSRVYQIYSNWIRSEGRWCLGGCVLLSITFLCVCVCVCVLFTVNELLRSLFEVSILVNLAVCLHCCGFFCSFLPVFRLLGSFWPVVCSSLLCLAFIFSAFLFVFFGYCLRFSLCLNIGGGGAGGGGGEGRGERGGVEGVFFLPLNWDGGYQHNSTWCNTGNWFQSMALTHLQTDREQMNQSKNHLIINEQWITHWTRLKIVNSKLLNQFAWLEAVECLNFIGSVGI